MFTPRMIHAAARGPGRDALPAQHTPMAQLKTLVLGGYGNFGARICQSLAAGTPAAAPLQLLVAGRDARRAEALAASLGPHAGGVALDHQAPGLAGRLRALGVGLVIHTAG